MSDKTAAQIVAEALTKDQIGKSANPRYWEGESHNVLDALRAHGLLVTDAPTGEQIGRDSRDR